MRFVGIFSDGKFQGYPAPEQYEDCLILWRGYIGNPDNVKREARLRGIGPGDSSTGGLFVLAYRLWGVKLQTYITGEYAIAIFDKAASQLFLTHDAFGLVPLFYGRHPGRLTVSSHLEDIVIRTGVGKLDDEFIADYIANPSFMSHRTAYTDISRLAPEASLICRPEKEKEFKGPVPVEMKPYAGRDHDERFLQLLGEGLSAAIPPDGKVWCELSGGLDSSSIFSLAQRQGTGRLDAFSIVYNRYGQADETKWIESILERYPVPRHILQGDEALPYSEVPDRFSPEPGLHLVDWSGGRAYEKLAADNGVSVVLTGQGGDLVFYGIGPLPYYLADLAKALNAGQFLREIRRWKTSDRHRRSYLFWLVHYVMRPLLSHLRRQPILPGRVSFYKP